MLQLRQEQLDAFESIEATFFPARMQAHLVEYFPRHAALLGESGCRDVIRNGIDSARSHGFTRQAPAALLIDLSLLLGRGFDNDVQLPWAAHILADTGYTEDIPRAQRLHAVAMDYLDLVSGPDNEYIDNAQRRLLYEHPDLFTGSAEAFSEEVLFRLERIWPEKHARVGSAQMGLLITQGVARARAYGILSEPGWLVYVIMMYMLGSGFDRDPMFAWAQPVLQGCRGRNQAESTRLLHAAGLGYLKNWCV